MPIVHQFIGTATLYSDDPKFEKKENLPIRFKARFDAAVWRVRAADFEPVVIEDVKSGDLTFDLAVSLDELAKGNYDAATGSLSILTVFEFNPELPLVPSSNLEITLDGGSHTLSVGAVVQGRPYDTQNGQLGLAGVGKFISGTLKNTKCAIQLDGKFSPSL